VGKKGVEFDRTHYLHESLKLKSNFRNNLLISVIFRNHIQTVFEFGRVYGEDPKQPI
jgi:hypothetical protein